MGRHFLEISFAPFGYLQKIILVLAIFLALFWGSVSTTKAQFACASWYCHDGGYDQAGNYKETCDCTDGSVTDLVCASGSYASNNICTNIGAPACFLPGTTIQSSSDSKKIENVKIGDSVTSFDDSGKIVESKVSNIYKVQRDFYYSIVAGGYQVKVTAEHPFYIGNGDFKEAKDLKTGDVVYVLEGGKLVYKVIAQNVRMDKVTDAYNLSVDKTETFFANDFAVHNKCLCGTYDAREDGGGAYACIPHPNQNDCNGAGIPEYINGCISGTHKEPWPEGPYNGACLNDADIASRAYDKGGCCMTSYAGCRRDPDCQGTCTHWNAIATQCVADCSATNPNTPTLVFPSNGAGVGSTTVVLFWTAVNFGVGCPQNNSYNIYIGTDPNNLTLSNFQTQFSFYTFTGAFNTTYYWQIGALNGSREVKSAVWSFTIGSFNPWWQVKDSDIATNGGLSSNVASAKFFGLPGDGGFPGVPAYGGSVSFGDGSASQTYNWVAKSPIGNPKVYDYQYFANQVPATTVINTLPTNVLDQAAIDAGSIDPGTGYYWYKFDNISGLDLSVDSAVNIGSRKVVLFVNSNFNVNANISLTDGQGFFMAIAKGNVVVDPMVGGGTTANPDLEGLYVADNAVGTGVATIPLYVRGSVVGYNGVNLQRDLGAAANSDPSEVFEYAPDQIMLFPKVLGSRKISWKEVAP